MSSFTERYGPWSLVTGASAGLGAEFAAQLARRGINVVLVARRNQRLEQLAASLCENHGIQAKALALDVTSGDLEQVVEEATRSLDIGLLINNAGSAQTGAFVEHSLEQELSQMYLNCRAPLVLAHHFGRRFVARGGGGIVNVCALAAFMPMPRWSHYAATKAYSLHLSAGLWHELAEHQVDVLALCPGATSTEFAEVAGMNHQGGMEPEMVVASALARLGHGPMVVPGFANRMRSWLLKRVSTRKAIDIGAGVVSMLQEPQRPPQRAGGVS